MKTSLSRAHGGFSSRRQTRSEMAFTMVEIAIALAIIGFALVAIIGVLPSGLEVQKDNREETVINQDAVYFMDAMRSGARGADDLTNYVFAITNYWTTYDANTNRVANDLDGYDRLSSRITSIASPPIFPITNGFRIIGLLGTPKYLPLGAGFRSNHVIAYVHSLSGPASEKVPQRDATVQDLAFSYRFISEVVTVPMAFTNTPYARNLRENLHEVRLLFRWPLFPNGNTGNGRQVYRLQVGGGLLATNVGQTLYFFEPTVFAAKP